MQKKPFSDQITKDNEGEEMGEKIKEGVGVRIVQFFPPILQFRLTKPLFLKVLTGQHPFTTMQDISLKIFDMQLFSL